MKKSGNATAQKTLDVADAKRRGKKTTTRRRKGGRHYGPRSAA